MAGQELRGGATQIEFEKYNPWGDEDTWKKYLEELEKIDGIRKYEILLK